jgi:hypothetical protein
MEVPPVEEDDFHRSPLERLRRIEPPETAPDDDDAMRLHPRIIIDFLTVDC